MTGLPQATIDAADAWAREHGCPKILACNQTPLAAFAAGMAAERERIAQAAQERLNLLDPADFSPASQAIADILIICDEGAA